jgi:hypothetical protein
MTKTIKRIAMLFVVVCATGTACVETNPVDLTGFVNPMVGTDYHGHTFPGAALPEDWCN